VALPVLAQIGQNFGVALLIETLANSKVATTFVSPLCSKILEKCRKNAQIVRHFALFQRNPAKMQK